MIILTDEEYGDDDDYSDETPCDRCNGDGMDPWNDYLLPCPMCQGEQVHYPPKHTLREE